MALFGKKKAKYTEEEKRAWAAGRAYAAAKKGKRLKLRTKKEENSFKEGYNSVK